MRGLLLYGFVASLPATGAVRYMLLGYGQSLSLGNWGCPAISTSQPYANLTLNTGQTAFVPLTEPGSCVGGTAWSATASYQAGALVTSGGNTYSALAPNANVTPSGNPATWQPVTVQESPTSSAANNLTYLDPAHAITTIWKNYGQSGTPISGLQRSTGPYTNLINGVTAARNLAAATGDTLVVLGILFTEGESDFQNASTTYYTDNLTLQGTLEADIRSITGQQQPVPFFFSQLSSNESSPAGNDLLACPDGTTACIDDPTGAASPLPTIAQWRLQRDYPTKFYLTGPKYQYFSGDQGYHLSGPSYNNLGATAARILKSLYIDRSASSVAGVFPSRISISGSVITVSTLTPNNLSLTLDNATIPDPYRNGAYDTAGKGFQFFQTGGNSPAITGVSVSGQTITITLSAVPTGTNQRLAYSFEGQRYAATPTAGCSFDAASCNGLTITPSRGTVHGNVRTVTDYTDLRGDPVQHWMVHFNEPIGFSWSPSAPATLSSYKCSVIDGTGGSGVSNASPAIVTCKEPHSVRMRAWGRAGFASNSAPANNSTITLDSAGSNQTYTFVTSLNNSVPNQVLIGGDNANIASNLAHAINNDTGAGALYSSPTVANPTVAAAYLGVGNAITNGSVYLFYRVPGSAGNGVTWSASTSPNANLGDWYTGATSGTLQEQWWVNIRGASGSWTNLGSNAQPATFLAKYNDPSSFLLYSTGGAAINTVGNGSFSGQTLYIQLGVQDGTNVVYSNHSEDWALRDNISEPYWQQTVPSCSNTAHDAECALTWKSPEVSRHPTNLSCGLNCADGAAYAISSLSISGGIATVTVTSPWAAQNNTLDLTTTGKAIWIRGVADPAGAGTHSTSYTVGNTGVTAHQLVKFTPGANTVVPVGWGDFGGAVGVAETTVGPGGTVVVDDGGLITCNFASATTAGHRAIININNYILPYNAQCYDAGGAGWTNNAGNNWPTQELGVIQQTVAAGQNATVWWDGLNRAVSNYTLCGTWPSCTTFTFPAPGYGNGNYTVTGAYVASTGPLAGYMYLFTGPKAFGYPEATVGQVLQDSTNFNPATTNRYDFYTQPATNIQCGTSNGSQTLLGDYSIPANYTNPNYIIPRGPGYHNGCLVSYANQWTHVLYGRGWTSAGAGTTQNYPMDAQYTGYLPAPSFRGARHYFDGLESVYWNYAAQFKPTAVQSAAGQTVNFNSINLGTAATPEPEEVVTMLAAAYGTPNRWQPTDTNSPTGTAGYHLMWNGPNNNNNITYEVRYSTSGSIHAAGFSSGTCAISGNPGGSCTAADVVSAPGGSNTAMSILPNTPNNNALLSNIWFGLRPTIPVFGAGISGNTVYLNTQFDLGMATGDKISTSGINGFTGSGINGSSITTTSVTPRQIWWLNDPSQADTSFPSSAITYSVGGDNLVHVNLAGCCIDFDHSGYNFHTGDQVLIAGGGSLTFGSGLDGTWTITVVDANDFILQSSTGRTGPYSSSLAIRKVTGNGPLTSVTQSGGVCTANLNVNHNLAPGMMIAVYGTNDSGSGNSQNLWNSSGTDIASFAVTSIPTAGSFTFSCPGVTQSTMNQDYHPLAQMAIQAYPAIAYSATSPAGTWGGAGAVTPADDNRNFSEIQYTPQTCSISPTSAGPWTNTQTVSVTFAASGCNPSSWGNSGGLPTGLALNAASGVLAGTLTATGSFTPTVTYDTGSDPLAIVVNPAPSISTISLPSGVTSQPYSQPVSVSGGTTPVACSISSGALPPGITLNSSTSLISGDPTAAGAYNFTVTATDANLVAASQSLSLTVNLNTNGATISGGVCSGCRF